MSGGILDPKQPGFGTQVRELVAWMRAHPAGGVFITLVIVVALATALRPPAAATPDRLSEGDCLSLRGVTAPADVAAAVLAGKADRAACGTPHSHEVAAAEAVPAHATCPPIALGCHQDDQTHIDGLASTWCDAAFITYVGRVQEASIYRAIPVASTLGEVQAGTGVEVCLVGRDDGAPMTSLARGSGE